MSNLREIFDAIDTDHNGFVDKKELTTVVRACNEAGMLGDKPLSESEVEKMAGVSQLDSENDNFQNTSSTIYIYIYIYMLHPFSALQAMLSHRFILISLSSPSYL